MNEHNIDPLATHSLLQISLSVGSVAIVGVYFSVGRLREPDADGLSEPILRAAALEDDVNNDVAAADDNVRDDVKDSADKTEDVATPSE
jgi:hypothetical protein